MDQSATWPESLPSNRIKAFQELTRGQELANNLREMLQWPGNLEFDPTYEDGLVIQIVSMFKNTLSVLGSCTSSQHLEIPTTDLCLSGQISEGNIIPAKRKKGCHKRRKNSWTSSQVTSTLIDDGHAWRKYGQKHINNSNHQRSYYRCTYKFNEGCLAAKQVQMIQDKPPKYKTTYIGNHTCKNLQRAPKIILDTSNSRDTSILFNFETKGFITKTQVGTNFPSIKHGLKEGYTSHDNLRHDLYLSSSDLACSLNACVSHNPLGPISKTKMPLAFNHGDIISARVHSMLDDHNGMISSSAYESLNNTRAYEIGHMLGMNDFNDFPSQIFL